MDRTTAVSCLSRRRFLTASGLLVAGMLPGCASTSVYRVEASRGKVLVNQGDYPELGAVGGMVQLRVPGRADVILLVRGADGYLALSAVCTHQGCTVRPSRHALVCPCHGSTYDLSGKVVRGPAEQPLARFRTALSENGVEIHLE